MAPEILIFHSLAMIKILLVVFLLCFESICASQRKPKTSTKGPDTSVVKYVRDQNNYGELEQNYGIKFLRYYKVLKKFDDLFSTEFVNNFGNHLKKKI